MKKNSENRSITVFAQIKQKLMILAMTLISTIMLMSVITPVEAAAATNIYRANISGKAGTGNATNVQLPADQNSTSGNQRLHINGQVSSDIKLKEIIFEVMYPGNSTYQQVGKEVFNNYGRYGDASFVVPNTSGTMKGRVIFVHTNGSRKTVYTNDCRVSAVNTTFNPQWPFSTSINYITTMNYYWNKGNPSGHSCRSNKYNGMDISVVSGTNVKAIEAGKVIESKSGSTGFGNYIVIEHANGLCSLYGHLSSRSVSVGTKVSKGQIIGKSGSSGNSTGPHLHLEIYRKSNYSEVIKPFMTYYANKVKCVIGGNSRKANAYFKNDSIAKAWVTFLDTRCTKNSAGDYVMK